MKARRCSSIKQEHIASTFSYDNETKWMDILREYLGDNPHYNYLKILIYTQPNKLNKDGQFHKSRNWKEQSVSVETCNAHSSQYSSSSAMNHSLMCKRIVKI